MDYKIVSGTLAHVEEEVITLLAQGWRLAGGVSVTSDEMNGVVSQSFAQALTKE